MKVALISMCLVLLAFNASALSRNSIKEAMAGSMKLDSDSFGSDTWKDYFDAFLDGANVDEIVANSTDCVHDVEYSYDDTAEAISHFVSRGWSWETWLDLNEAIGTYTPLVRTCYDVTADSVEDAKDHFQRFDSVTDFALQAKDNIVVHIFDWYNIISKFNEAISKKKNKEIAFQAGAALNLFLNFDSKLTPTNGQESELYALGDIDDLLRNAEEFMKGFLNGTKVLSSQRVKNCVNETEFMVASVEDAVDQFQKHTDEGFREGVFEIADTFEHFKPINEQCYYAVGDIETTIQKYIKTFKTPLDILFNAARHFNELYGDILGFIQHTKNGEWYDSGKDFGDIFYNIFFDQ
jgi:hypothetical protein